MNKRWEWEGRGEWNLWVSEGGAERLVGGVWVNEDGRFQANCDNTTYERLEDAKRALVQFVEARFAVKRVA